MLPPISRNQFVDRTTNKCMSDTPRRSLPQIHIAERCPADWSTMQGDARTRFCEACGLHVHNVSDMTTLEAEELLRCRSVGRLCVRFAVAPDGTPITRDHPQAKLLDYAPLPKRSRLFAVLPLVGVAIGVATAVVAWARPKRVVTPPVMLMGDVAFPATFPTTTTPSTTPATTQRNTGCATE
jgi:hypothetical protein